MGDKELTLIQPENENDAKNTKQEKWTMVRCGWHWISVDLLFASIGLAIINFTDSFDNETALLQILAVYFLGYAIIWVIIIAISKPFAMNFIKLGQWMLLLAIAALIFFSI